MGVIPWDPPKPRRPIDAMPEVRAMEGLPMGPPKPPPEPPPKQWWEFVRDERVAKSGGDVTMWTEYVGTTNGVMLAGFDAKPDEAPGGFVPPIELGDPHPVHPGLIAAQIDVYSPIDGPVTVRVKWVGSNGVCVDPLAWQQAQGAWRKADEADSILVSDIHMFGRPAPDPPDAPGNVSAATGRLWRKRRRLSLSEIAERRHRRHWWRPAASIGGLVLWAGAVWLFASSV